MYTGFFDIINSIIQCSMFIITINYCIDHKYKKNKIQIIALIAIISLVIIIITSAMGNYSLSIIILHIISLMLAILPYYKDKLTATIGFSIIYFIICIISIVSFIIFSLFTSIISIDNKYISLVMILIMYLPSYIISYLIMRNMKFIYKVYLMIKSRTSSIIAFIIITIVCDFIISFSYIVNGTDNPIFMEVIFVLLGIFIISVTWYFAIVNKKSNEIYNLNKELEKKINELKKIKHDYGSQISYLYGAYLMKNYDKLGELFKSVIEGNNISTQVKVLSYENSLISRIVNSIDLNDIDILIDEKAKLEDTKINEIDLQRIVSNILRNSVEALNGKGLLMIKSFYNYNNIVVSIQNNGPKIDKNNIDKIFEQGFSTKENKDRENGFGLYIVKELIDKYNGNIYVKSNEDLTEFIINLPLNL
ncbi:ATP-binding protein [Clostridium sp. C8]|jgi:two-component system, LytTR family, sensor histidine kinase AgrC|uniref:Histidine kinase domain-containing protein n=1 Tax=bioreactor metagenome TaxID=1076179 RepID=A0A644X7S4_9ZZZZ|nr:ATP-binding protein [Clostridium sp. C8]KLE14838.1 histidine kinase [Clostridium sp. C8]